MKTIIYCVFVRENATAEIVHHEILEMDEAIPAKEAVERSRAREIALAEDLLSEQNRMAFSRSSCSS